MRHYLDYASTAPLRPEAKAAMLELLEESEFSGDPSRIHSEGMQARYIVETAREQIADFLGAAPREVMFTSGATESIASAILGVMQKIPEGHIITSAIEHSSVLETVEQFSNTQIEVDGDGIMDPQKAAEAIQPDTVLFSFQHANHEIGTLQDIEALIKPAVEREILTHIDAAQSVGHIGFDFAKSSADLVSISSHKMGGPTGTGVLLIRQGKRIGQLLKGGNQELSRRGGIENLFGIVGLAAVAKTLSPKKLAKEASSSKALIDLAIKSCSEMEGIEHYGSSDSRAPHIACFGFKDIEPQAVLLELDRRGISVHSGSSCSSAELLPSSVLSAIGVDAERSLRVSVGWNSTKSDIEAFVAALAEVLKYLRELRL